MRLKLAEWPYPFLGSALAGISLHSQSLGQCTFQRHKHSTLHHNVFPQAHHGLTTEAMIRSLCLRQMQSVSFKRSIALRPVLRLTKCAPLSPLTASSFELSPLLVRSASSTPPPKSKATPKTSAKSATNASKPARRKHSSHSRSLTD